MVSERLQVKTATGLRASPLRCCIIIDESVTINPPLSCLPPFRMPSSNPGSLLITCENKPASSFTANPPPEITRLIKKHSHQRPKAPDPPESDRSRWGDAAGISPLSPGRWRLNNIRRLGNKGDETEAPPHRPPPPSAQLGNHDENKVSGRLCREASTKALFNVLKNGRGGGGVQRDSGPGGRTTNINNMQQQPERERGRPGRASQRAGAILTGTPRRDDAGSLH